MRRAGYASDDDESDLLAKVGSGRGNSQKERKKTLLLPSLYALAAAYLLAASLPSPLPLLLPDAVRALSRDAAVAALPGSLQTAAVLVCTLGGVACAVVALLGVCAAAGGTASGARAAVAGLSERQRRLLGLNEDGARSDGDEWEDGWFDSGLGPAAARPPRPAAAAAAAAGGKAKRSPRRQPAASPYRAQPPFHRRQRQMEEKAAAAAAMSPLGSPPPPAASTAARLQRLSSPHAEIVDEYSLSRYLNEYRRAASGLSPAPAAAAAASANNLSAASDASSSGNRSATTVTTAATQSAMRAAGSPPFRGAGMSPYAARPGAAGSPWRDLSYAGGSPSPFSPAGAAASPSPSRGSLAGSPAGISAPRPVARYARSSREPERRRNVATGNSFPAELPLERADMVCADRADALLAELRLSECMADTADRMRMWLSGRLVRPKAREFDRSLRFLHQVADLLLHGQGSALSADEQALLRDKQPTHQLSSFLRQRVTEPGVARGLRAREMLERYLDCGSKSEKSYVRGRLAQLAEGGFMAEYEWDGGGEWNGRPWQPHLPTDAKIVMHAFCTFMDEVLPGFTERHYIEAADRRGEGKRPEVAIVEMRVNPPYYMIRHKKGHWYVRPRRENLFHALVLFLHYVVAEMGGGLGSARLSDPAMQGILQVMPSRG